MWHLLQGSIMFAIMGTNIHWQWTPNQYVPAILGWVLALLVTVGLNNLLLWARKRSASKPPPLPRR